MPVGLGRSDEELSLFPGHNRTFKNKAASDEAYGIWVRAEGVRVAEQRRAFAAIPESAEKAAFQKAVLERAAELLDAGFPGAADQLLEFVPKPDAEAFHRDYFPE